MIASNTHGTAIVLGTTGLLFVGPSGSGKSTVALDCLLAAERAGVFAALISDDQVLLSQAGNRIVARAPASIKGLMEIRGSGIARVRTINAALLHYAIAPVSAPFNERIPAENEVWSGLQSFYLPLLRLPFANNAANFDRLKTVLPAISAF